MIGVYGAGAFGTALAVALARDGSEVRLFARQGAARIGAARENAARLPGVTLPRSVTVTGTAEDLAGAEALLLVVPAQQIPALLPDLPEAPLVLAAKGIVAKTGALLPELAPNAAVLTGPGFAAEIARGMPTALTLAAASPDGARLQQLLSRPDLRLYRSEDRIGAALGGALKNVIAIAVGAAHGMGLGESAKAALMTRGFAEMRRLARALGAEDRTLAGLSGLGDLALTCGSDASRNFAHGAALGAGQTPAQATVEGVATAAAALQRAARHEVSMPVTEMTAALVAGQLDGAAARRALMARPLAQED